MRGLAAASSGPGAVSPGAAVSPGVSAGRSGTPLTRLLRLAKPLRARLWLAVLAGALATGCSVGLMAVSGFLLARASFHPNIVEISVAVTAVRALGIGKGVFRYGERLAAHDVAFRVLSDVRVAIYRKLERLAPAGLTAFRAGDLLARLVSDVNATQDLFIRGIAPPAAAALIGAGATIGVMTALVPDGLVIAAGLLIAGLAAPWLTAAIARRSATRTAPARGDFAARFSAMIEGIADIHVLDAQRQVLAGLEDADGTLAAMGVRSAGAEALGAGIGSIAAGLTLWAVLLLSVGVAGPAALARVPLAAVTLTALAAFEAVNGLPGAASQIAHARSSAGRITAVLDAPDPVREPADPVPVPPGPLHLRLEAVRVRYAAPTGPPALDAFSLDLPPGRRVALVGPVGAGKSTVASVLFRFIEPEAGSVTLNGVAITSLAAESVREVIGGCPQDPYVFDTTIRENLRLAKPDAADDELTEAARRARLSGWIESLPDGWDTPVGAHGRAVSGGERQRLALARALLADPAVLVLDEPTAHLDPETGAGFIADVLDATAGRSLLLITHDLAQVEGADEIIVLEHGVITQRGTHERLLAGPGWYARMASPFSSTAVT